MYKGWKRKEGRTVTPMYLQEEKEREDDQKKNHGRQLCLKV